MRILIRVLAVMFLFKLPVVLAQSFDYSGQVALEVRGFPEEPLLPGQFEGAQFSSFLEPEFRWRNADRDSLLKFTPFIRVDAVDDKRTHFDIRKQTGERLQVTGNFWRAPHVYSGALQNPVIWLI